VNSERAMASLEQQARFWEERAAQMREAVEAMRREMREAERGARTLGVRRGPGRPPSVTGGRGRRGQGAGSAAAEVLREWGRAARGGELLPELERRGVHVGGKNPLATLASTLLKYSGVAKAGRGLFIAGNGNGAAAPKRTRGKKGVS
jgi:hypothetical protein